MDQDFQSNLVKLMIASDPKWMKLVRGVVACVADRMHFKRRQVKNIILAIDEACTNIIKHAYLGNKEKEILIYLRTFDDRLEILLKDFGRKGNPETFKPRALDDIRPGGLGIHLIRRVMDEAKYDVSGEVGTELLLVKYKKKERDDS